MEGYLKFVKNIIEINEEKLKKCINYSDSGDNIQQYINENIKPLKNGMIYNLSDSKIFIVDENINILLYNTKYNKKEIYQQKFPFSNIFIDTKIPFSKFVGDELWKKGGSPELFINGLWLTDLTNIRNEGLSRGVTFFLPSIWQNGNEPYDKILFYDLNENKSNYNDKLYNFIISYISNFLNFINEPNIEIVEVERTQEQNTKRIKEGKIPIPKLNYIRLKGELKIYMDKLESSGAFHYSHKFWIRGHWRILRNEKRYKNKIGTKMWIKPYIKGNGILINKNYILNGDN